VEERVASHPSSFLAHEAGLLEAVRAQPTVRGLPKNAKGFPFGDARGALIAAFLPLVAIRSPAQGIAELCLVASAVESRWTIMAQAGESAGNQIDASGVRPCLVSSWRGGDRR
jgi:hypothetical protein